MLNPELYRQLKQIFPQGVKVANEDIAFSVVQQMDFDGQIVWRKHQSSEEYHVCCPMCGDTRFRLYINHMWGRGQFKGIPVNAFVVCQNEHCERSDDLEREDRGNVIEFLRKRLKPYFHEVNDLHPLMAQAIANAEESAMDPLPFPKPEWCIPLAESPAKRYLEETRKFDTGYLSNRWGVVYAKDYPVQANGRKYDWLAGRIFIPTGNNGWQARDIKGTSDVKYFSCPGWKKSQCIYNLDTARQHSMVVLMEGVTDVWRVEDFAVCIFGKTLSNNQLDDLAANFGAVAVMLHDDAFERNPKNPTAVPEGRRTLERLRSRVPMVFRVELPAGVKDAAETTTEVVLDCIYRAATRAGIGVSHA